MKNWKLLQFSILSSIFFSNKKSVHCSIVFIFFSYLNKKLKKKLIILNQLMDKHEKIKIEKKKTFNIEI